MFRTALRNVLAHRSRLLMTALAVILGVAFVTGTLVFSDTVGGALRNASAKNLNDVAVSVTAQNQPASEPQANGEHSSTALDTGTADKIRSLPGVKSVRSTVNGTATVAGKDHQPIGASWQNLATNFQPGKDGNDSRYPLVEGRGPVAHDEIALDKATALAGRLKIGDSVRFAVDGPTITKRLVGVVSSQDPRVTAGGSLALFDTATAQQLFLEPGKFDELTVAAISGTDQQKLTAEVGKVLPEGLAQAISGTDLAAQQSEEISRSNRSLSQSLLIFAGIALFVGVFIIANTFTMLVSQRSREIALLRAIGASRRQVVRSVLIEAALLGLASSAVGFLLGVGIAAALRPLLNASGAGLPAGRLIVSPTTAMAALAIGVLVTVLAAWLPSRKAAKIAPVEALNSVDAAPALRSLLIRNSLGAAVTALGAAIMLYVSTFTNSEGIEIAMLGSVTTLVGVIILAPLLSRPLVMVSGWLTVRCFGVAGKLAQENALRNPRRTAATASALMIGVTLITGMTVVGHSTQIGMDKMAIKDLRADYKVRNSQSLGLPAGMTEEIAAVRGVEAAVPIRMAGFEAANSVLGSVTATDLSTLGAVTSLRFTQGSADELRPGAIAASQTMARKAGWKVGDTVALKFSDRSTARVRLVGVYEDNLVVGNALGTADTVDPHLETLRNSAVLVKSDGSNTSLAKDIRNALDNSPLLKVQDRDQLRKEGAGTIDTVLNMLFGLLGMAVIIAVLGVVNTLAMSVVERTREIGMLRAIGLSRAGVKQMIRLEAIVISLFGAVLGMGVGTFLAWAGGSLVGSSFPTYQIVLPWGQLALTLLLALAVGVLAAVWPARRASRLNVLEAIGTQ